MVSSVAIIAFILSAAFLLYVLAGYPLLLAWRARRAFKPILKQPQRKTVSVVMPVRNGERWIRAKLENLIALDYPRNLVEILVISDGSEDRTDSCVQEFVADNVQLIRIPKSGKATALNIGIAQARGDILFFTDVRQTLATDSLTNLVSCFADPSVGVASGELVILDGTTREEANVGLYWRYEKWIRIRLSRIDSVMGATGAIYAMRRELAVVLPPGTLCDDMHLPLAAFVRGYRVILDSTAKAFDYPTVLQTEFRRKVRTLAGVYQIVGAFPSLLSPANRMWLHFVSHKFARLLLPWDLLILFLASLGLPPPWKALAIDGQALFYLLAIVDLLVPEKSALKRLSSPTRTFVVLIAAAFVASSILVRRGRGFWKETKVATAARPLP
jgi:cellulose synthase/poly-beta-1,6-N-acetylglucosamine synthase-like glycosyltransferase